MSRAQAGKAPQSIVHPYWKMLINQDLMQKAAIGAALGTNRTEAWLKAPYQKHCLTISNRLAAWAGGLHTEDAGRVAGESLCLALCWDAISGPEVSVKT